MKTVIRRYRPEDAKPVHALDLRFPDPQPRRVIYNPPKHEQRFVAMNGGRLIGYIFIRYKKETAYVANLGVSRDFHGGDTGYRLMNRAVAWARAQTPFPIPVYLHVNARNRRAIAFYRRYGFQWTKTYHGYYGGDSSWYMRLPAWAGPLKSATAAGS